MKACFKVKKIEKQTLGKILKKARTKLQLSCQQVEKQTSIRQEYLSALEKGEFNTLPIDVYTIGYLRRYAQFLKIPCQPLVDLYKQESCIFKNFPPKADRPWAEKLNNGQITLTSHLSTPIFMITPKLVFVSFAIVLVLSLLGYIFFQVKTFTSPPYLEISQPEIETVVNYGEILILGKTGTAASLTINNQPVNVDAFGNFQQLVKLSSGLNTIEVKALNRLSKQTTKTLKILANF